jgi:hypothetical protein
MRRRGLLVFLLLGGAPGIGAMSPAWVDENESAGAATLSFLGWVYEEPYNPDWIGTGYFLSHRLGRHRAARLRLSNDSSASFSFYGGALNGSPFRLEYRQGPVWKKVRILRCANGWRRRLTLASDDFIDFNVPLALLHDDRLIPRTSAIVRVGVRGRLTAETQVTWSDPIRLKVGESYHLEADCMEDPRARQLAQVSGQFRRKKGVDPGWVDVYLHSENGASYRAQCDSEGRFFIDLVRPDDYSLQVSWGAGSLLLFLKCKDFYPPIQVCDGDSQHLLLELPSVKEGPDR